MSKILKKAAILFAIFATVVVLYFIIDRGSRSNDGTVYVAMEDATLPVVYAQMYGREMNLMHGYLQDMGQTVARDSLTILPADRALPIRIADSGSGILGIRYEIRSLDLQRLVEDTRLEQWESGSDGVTAILPIQNLLTKDKEYLLRLDVDTEKHGTIYYYTRILWSDNTNIESMVDLAVDFSARTFDYEQARSLVTYLETNDTEDNSSFGHTTIRSSFSQLTWGRLKMRPKGEVQVYFKELDGIMGVVQLRYLAAREHEDKTEELYEVEESFTMKWNSPRTYLMDYDRTVNQVFRGDGSVYSGKRIMLGITSDDQVRAKRSPNQNVLAFCSNRDIWSYNQDKRHSVKVFSFRQEEEEDVRGNYNQHGAKILQVSDTGDIDFLVYGYMNRGQHEGKMGIACYRYDESENAIEEKFFIPTTSDYDQLSMDLEQLTSMNETGMLYLYIDHAIYGIDLQSNEYLVVADALSEDSYAVSFDKTRIAWQEGNKPYEAEKLNLMNLETGEKMEISGEDGGLVRPLGFVGKDLVYGLARKGDLWVINKRIEDLPMYALEIVNEQMQVETRYEKPSHYIAGVTVEESRVHLNRVSRLSEQSYTYVQEDTIVCNQDMGPGKLDGIGWYASQDKGKLYFVQIDQEIRSNRGVRISTPKKVSYENSEILELKSNYQVQGMRFYAYGGGRLLGATADFAEALQLAYDRMGYVVDQNQNMLWNRVNRGSSYQIKDPAIAGMVIQNHLEDFASSRSYSDGTILLDARGSNMMQVLYFVEQGVPVLGYTGEGEYLLLCGYDQYNVTIYNPNTRETTKVGLNDGTEYFRTRGNDFICAVLVE